MKRKKNQKRPITESAGTPWYGGFRSSDLNTAASSARLIFLRKAIVQGRSRSGAWHAIGELKKKKRRITESSVTLTHNAIEHSNWNTVASLAKRIFSLKSDCFKDGPKHPKCTRQVKPDKKTANH